MAFATVDVVRAALATAGLQRYAARLVELADLGAFRPAATPFPVTRRG